MKVSNEIWPLSCNSIVLHGWPQLSLLVLSNCFCVFQSYLHVHWGDGAVWDMGIHFSSCCSFVFEKKSNNSMEEYACLPVRCEPGRLKDTYRLNNLSNRVLCYLRTMRCHRSDFLKSQKYQSQSYSVLEFASLLPSSIMPTSKKQKTHAANMTLKCVLLEESMSVTRKLSGPAVFGLAGVHYNFTTLSVGHCTVKRDMTQRKDKFTTHLLHFHSSYIWELSVCLFVFLKKNLNPCMRLCVCLKWCFGMQIIYAFLHKSNPEITPSEHLAFLKFHKAVFACMTQTITQVPFSRNSMLFLAIARWFPLCPAG